MGEVKAGPCGFSEVGQEDLSTFKGPILSFSLDQENMDFMGPSCGCPILEVLKVSLDRSNGRCLSPWNHMSLKVPSMAPCLHPEVAVTLEKRKTSSTCFGVLQGMET